MISTIFSVLELEFGFYKILYFTNEVKKDKKSEKKEKQKRKNS